MGSHGLQDEPLCRVCGESSETSVDLFNEAVNDVLLSDTLAFYLPLEVRLVRSLKSQTNPLVSLSSTLNPFF